MDDSTEPTARVIVRRVIVVLAAAAVAAAAWSGWRWWDETHSGEADTARLRVAVLAAAKPGIEAFNTLDFHDVDQGLDAWQRAATGQLLDDVKASREASAKAITEARTSTTATVLAAAVTELDDRAGTATVMAAVEVKTTVDGQQPTTKRNRYLAGLARTGDGWKLSSLQPVVVGI